MNMQQMLIQAQQVQRKLQKAQDELKQKEFTVTKGGAVTVVVKGDKTIKSILIDKDAFDADNKEMIAMAINEAVATIEKESEAINQQLTGRAGGLF